MAVSVTDLQAAADALSAELATQSAALAAAIANPKPSYSVGGRSVQWTEYRAQFVAQIRDLTAQLESLQQQIINATGAVEVGTIVFG